MITIVDYGVGNVGSLVKILHKIRVETELAGDAAAVGRARKLILPGVGHFATAMKELRNRDLIGPLAEKALGERISVLGVCLGMQLLGRHSEEGDVEGLGWIDAECVRFRFEPPVQEKVPNMGWRRIDMRRPSPLFPAIDKPWRFYFVHSYHLVCRNSDDVLATAHHGIDFTAAVASDNIQGVQFHPEKSHQFGMKMLTEFARSPA